MPDPRLATLTAGDGGRMYTHPVTREQHVSSTTVLKTLAKELSRWAAAGAAGEAWDNRYWLLGVSRQQAVDAFAGWPFRKRDERGDAGTLVHRGAELLALRHAGYELTGDQLAELMPLLNGAQGPTVQQGVFRWAEWASMYVAEWLHLEQTVWGNGYAGTFDAIVRLRDGRTALVDYKTAKAIYRETKLQLASYAFAPVMLNAEGVVTPMPEINVAGVVHLPEAGGFTFQDLEVDSDDLEAFERILDHWHWCERVPKNPGRPVPLAAAPGKLGQQTCGARKPGGTSGRPGSIACIEPAGHPGRHHGKSSTGSRNYYWDEDVPAGPEGEADRPAPDAPAQPAPPAGTVAAPPVATAPVPPAAAGVADPAAQPSPAPVSDVGGMPADVEPLPAGAELDRAEALVAGPLFMEPEGPAS
jgi:hypothetical protein